MAIHRFRSLAVRVGAVLAGCLLMGAGVSMIVKANLGADPYTVIVDGTHRRFGVPLAVSNVLVGCALVAIAWLMGRRPGPTAVATIGAVGLFIAACDGFIPDPARLGARVVMMIAAVAAIGVGVGAYQSAHLGDGPIDAVASALALRGWQPTRAFTVMQIAFLALGWALGGVVGAGTVVGALGLGPIARVCATDP